MKLSGWGRYPIIETQTKLFRDQNEAWEQVNSATTVIARGNGRAYGDSAISPDTTLLTRRFDRLVKLDQMAGLLECEAGLLLAELLPWLVERGWFLPVVPGTKFVSVGGMLASDIHGKNHHIDGSICAHVESMTILLADGSVVNCSYANNAELFSATLGGMGLTGIILRAELRLRPIETPIILQRTLHLPDLKTTLDAFITNNDWPYSVAWIDCLAQSGKLGRSILFLGRHVGLDAIEKADKLRPTRNRFQVPFACPKALMNRWTVGTFNSIYRLCSRPGDKLVHYDHFFFPLDRIYNWNLLYGRKGFIQYQCVIPRAEGHAGLFHLLTKVSQAGAGSFLSVLKLLGKESGPLSFPMEGYTLAIDFPVCSSTITLIGELDKIVLNHGGRLYLAKDARMDPHMLIRGYHRLDEFMEIRDFVDPGHRFGSCQSIRLGI